MPLRHMKTILVASLISGAFSTLVQAGPACRKDQMVPAPVPNKQALEALEVYYKNAASTVMQSFLLAINNRAPDERRFGLDRFEKEWPRRIKLEVSGVENEVNGQPMMCKGSSARIRAGGTASGQRVFLLPAVADMFAVERNAADRAMGDLQRLKDVRRGSQKGEREADDARLQELEKLHLVNLVLYSDQHLQTAAITISLNADSWANGAIVWGTQVAKGAAPVKLANVVLEIDDPDGPVSSFMAPAAQALKEAMDADIRQLLSAGPRAGVAADLAALEVRVRPLDRKADLASRKQAVPAAATALQPSRGNTAASNAPSSVPNVPNSPTAPAESPTGAAAKEVINNIPGQAGSILRGIFGR